jgi:integrase
MIRKRTRKNKDGKVISSYQAIVKVQGYPDQVKTFRTLKEADKWETKTKAEMHAGTFRDDKDFRNKTLIDAIERFEKEILTPETKNLKTILGHLRYWKTELGKHALRRLHPDLINKKIHELSQGKVLYKGDRAPATVNRYRATLSSVFTVAYQEWMWIDESPMKRVRKLKEPRGRIRYLSYEERDRLLPVCLESKNRLLYPIVIIALSTGMRRGEILNLKWSDIDLENDKAVLHNTKNGERRVVALKRKALEELKKLYLENSRNSLYAFPNKWGTGPLAFKSSWENAVRNASIEDFHFHDLRHTAASYMAMSGASLLEIAEFLGHKCLSMVRRYAHLTHEHTSGKVEVMSDLLFGT